MTNMSRQMTTMLLVVTVPNVVNTTIRILFLISMQMWSLLYEFYVTSKRLIMSVKSLPVLLK